jgi:hypothetical protein
LINAFYSPHPKPLSLLERGLVILAEELIAVSFEKKLNLTFLCHVKEID